MALVQLFERTENLRHVEENPRFAPLVGRLAEVESVLVSQDPEQVLARQILEHEVHVLVIDKRLVERDNEV